VSLGLLTRFGLTQRSAAITPPTEENEYGIVTIGTLFGANSSANQSGWHFGVRRATRSCVGARVYMDGTGWTETIRLWRHSDSSLLANANVNPLDDEWVEVMWGSPVELALGQLYAIGTRHQSGSSRARHLSNDNDNTGFVLNQHAFFVAGVDHNVDTFPNEGARIRGLADIILSDEYTEAHSPLVYRVGSTTANSSAQLGWEFTANAAITVTHLRVNLPSDSDEVVRLWRVSDEALLASESITSVTDTWVEVELSTPVELSAATNYVITTREASGGSRTLRNDTVSNVVVDPVASFVTSRFVSGTGYPSSATTNFRGIPDLRYEPS
jgi:hypothetical protein